MYEEITLFDVDESYRAVTETNEAQGDTPRMALVRLCEASNWEE